MKNHEKEARKITFIFLRYIIILILAVPNISLFYFVFTPLTVYPSSFILSFFYPNYIDENTIIIGDVSIELIEACIAGSAFYLLLLLNLSVPMKPGKRFFSLLFSFSSFLLINIIRIAVFSILFLNSFSYFDFTHKIFWYFLSGIIVFFVWILTIKIFKIEATPFYDDLKFIKGKK